MSDLDTLFRDHEPPRDGQAAFRARLDREQRRVRFRRGLGLALALGALLAVLAVPTSDPVAATFQGDPVLEALYGGPPEPVRVLSTGSGHWAVERVDLELEGVFYYRVGGTQVATWDR